MKYNLKSKTETEKAFTLLTEMAGKGLEVEIKKVIKRRSLSQNSYLHLLLGAFSIETGYNMEESKQLYKETNPHIYKYEKNGHVFWRSSAELSKEDMVTTIDRFKEAVQLKLGITLPDAVDQEWLRQIENDMEHQRKHL